MFRSWSPKQCTRRMRVFSAKTATFRPGKSGLAAAARALRRVVRVETVMPLFLTTVPRVKMPHRSNFKFFPWQVSKQYLVLTEWDPSRTTRCLLFLLQRRSGCTAYLSKPLWISLTQVQGEWLCAVSGIRALTLPPVDGKAWDWKGWEHSTDVYSLC